MISHKFCSASQRPSWGGVKALAYNSEGCWIESLASPSFFLFYISKMHIEFVRASISIQFDSIQSILTKFQCIDPTLVQAVFHFHFIYYLLFPAKTSRAHFSFYILISPDMACSRFAGTLAGNLQVPMWFVREWLESHDDFIGRSSSVLPMGPLSIWIIIFKLYRSHYDFS